MIFESVEIFVAFSTGAAAVGLVLFHAEGAGVGIEGLGVDDGEGAVFVCVEFLRVVSVLYGSADVVDSVVSRAWDRGGENSGETKGSAYGFVIFQSILILVCFFAANDWAMERLRYTPISRWIRHSCQLLLLPYRSCKLAIFAVLAITELSCRCSLRLLLLLPLWLLRIVPSSTIQTP